MKVTVYGAGNQELYINKLKLPERFGGEPPYGGARIAMDLANAGHDIVLCEVNKNVMSEELWKKVDDAGVKVVNDDLEGAKHGEVHILFTPFGKHTIKLAKNIIEHLPENAVICNTCTVSPIVLYLNLESLLRLKRKDIGISSFHPAAVPGTPQHKHYVISTSTLNNKQLATDEQINKLKELAESCGKKPYLVPADVSPIFADMGVLVTAVALIGILDYYTVGRKVIKAPKKMIEKQIVMSLETLAALIETSGIEGLLKVFDKELVIKSAESMVLLDEQTDIKLAIELLEKIDGDLDKLKEKGTINPTIPVSSQLLINEIISILGEKAAEGAIKRAMKGLYE
ncbi:H(2)-dependent methylenetetrahydromethanopterin dehydrogenase-related protein [Methanocaldococcus indicus]|uniref:H(2)-dependent methylenetetrahydromethanopterin dehydrogenase-related protein n=1 Tax=Methanocaldococcus indicus TaxID=213231 RepID=UPI003C6D096B